jgi:hypothetical protein
MRARRKASAQELPDWHTDALVMSLTERVSSLQEQQRQLEDALYHSAGDEDSRKNYADQTEALHMVGHASVEEVTEAQQAQEQAHTHVQQLRGELIICERELAASRRALPLAQDDAKIRTAEALQAAYRETAEELAVLLPQMISAQERIYDILHQAERMFPARSMYRQLETPPEVVPPIAGLPRLLIGPEWVPRISPSEISPKPPDHFGGPIAKLQQRLTAFLAEEEVHADA